MKQWLSEQWEKLTCYEVDTHHIDALDGIRAIAVLFVLWFHFWQQTWLMPTYPTPFLAFLGIEQINPGAIRWVGYVFVDMMVLISGFCLFLPHARAMFYGEKTDDFMLFYRKRIARILPSYLLCVVVIFIIAVIEGQYGNDYVRMGRDLLSHLSFTYMLRMDTYVHTPINGALWTICIEMQFYLIFPLLAKAFRKWHVLVYLLMVALGLWYTSNVALVTQPTAFYVNRFPTFLPVFANGMLMACAYVGYAKHVKRKGLFCMAATVLSVLSALWIWTLVESCFAASDKQLWQIANRYELSLAFSAFILTTCCALRPYRALLSNRLWKFVAAVSLNLYIWHQWLMVRISHSLGFTNGGDVTAAGIKMQYLLTGEGLAVAFLVAAILTYFWERPMAQLILRGRKNNIKEIK